MFKREATNSKNDSIQDNQAIIEVMDYSASRMQETTVSDVEKLKVFQKGLSTTWINVTSIKKKEIVNQLGIQFDLHPLTVADIHTEQRPKLEYFDNYIFLLLKMLDYDKSINDVTIEQVSIVIMPNVVISFQQRPGDVFDKIRESIRNDKSKIRKLGSDYLTYALTDAIVDNYFSVLEQIDDELDMVEEKLLGNPSTRTLHKLHRLKQKLLTVRKSVWPVRDSIHTLERSVSKIIKSPTLPYLRDLHDKTIRVIESVETQNDMIASMLDVYFSSLSNKMKESISFFP